MIKKKKKKNNQIIFQTNERCSGLLEQKGRRGGVLHKRARHVSETTELLHAKIKSASVNFLQERGSPENLLRFFLGGLSRCSCCLLNLLFEDEDALPLLWGQHGNLFWGQLQDLHDQSSLQRRGGTVYITPVLILRRAPSLPLVICDHLA